MTITYQTEKFESLIPEIKLLIDAHRDEVSLFSKSVAPLAPDWEAYVRLEGNGVLFTFTARDDGVLVGYYISFVATHIHYRHTMVSDTDIFYLRPEYRGGLVGYKLIKGAEHVLESLGVEIIIMSVKVDTGMEKLATKLGHKPLDIKYFREV